MDAKQKREFINTLCDSVRNSALMLADKMPAEWDGHELRKYLADKFEEQVSEVMRDRNKRSNAYRNEVIIHNL